ncbi:LamG-like jellyroll fold domain-containing protein [Spirillospora sp. NPDC047279]|uniref:LamG-like jellyroll fold domain-containing protein n=1 Tax=Spirillospora sp. NPDC047279 TaxID=3155478 RepID=UPI0033DECEE8
MRLRAADGVVVRSTVVMVTVAALLSGASGDDLAGGGAGADSGDTDAVAASATWASSAPTSAERLALTRARETGKRVEVRAKRTETMEVYADPRGHFTAQLHPGPVRVRQGGAWTPVDVTLTRTPDGSVAPRAVSEPLVFSGGGKGPLVRLGRGERHVALRWQGRLPTPVLKGSTATYPEVMPGVDLKLTANATGFSEVLVVKTRKAARNPRLRKVRFGVETNKLTLRKNDGGGAAFVSAKGETVFSSQAPAMWDAGSRDAVGRFDLARDAVNVIPDQKLLTDPATKFPVSIDPDLNMPMAGWAKVFQGKPGNSYWYGGGDVESGGPFDGLNLGKVGQCWNNGYCNGIAAARTYVQFDIRSLHGANIISVPNVTSGAEFNAHEVYAPACSAPAGREFGINLHHANPFDSSLDWGNQKTTLSGAIGGPRRVMHGYATSGDCGPAWIGWGVGDQVRYSNARTDRVAFMLRGTSESDQYGWKKFNSYRLLVHYNWPPSAPTNHAWTAGTIKRSCSTNENSPHYINNAAGPITLRAVARDRDGDPMWTRFEWWTRHGQMINASAHGYQGNGTEFSATIPQGALAHGRQISWRARSADQYGDGPWGPSPWCQFDIDNQAPGTPSVSLPSGTPTVGAPVTFTASAAAGDSDVVEYRYGLSQGGTQCRTTRTMRANTLGGSATFQVTPMKQGPWDVWVSAVDRANNVSPQCVHYRFDVRPGRLAVAHWPLDGRWTQTAVPDSVGYHDGTVIGSSRWTRGRVGDALRFNGNVDSHVAPGGGAAVRTDQSFSVSAWVRLAQTGGTTRIAVSQTGDRMLAFSLSYIGELNRYGFQMVTKDADDGQAVNVVAASPPQVGVWTHLTGVYDVTTKEMALYVDGVPQGTTTMSTPWASDSIQLGRGKARGAFGNAWPGDVDDVRMYDRALSDLPYLEAGDTAARSEIDRLAASPVAEAHYPLDEPSGDRAGDVSGHYRTAALTGATWVPGKVGGAVRFTDGQGLTSGPAVRTDSSFTVTAMVRTDVLDDERTAVSQEGALHSGFYLHQAKVGNVHRWVFHMVATPDKTEPDTTYVAATGAGTAPVTGEWTALAGVYDAQKREIRIYVNGALAGSAPFTSTWNATGPLVIGRAKLKGQPVAPWRGSIDEVHLYNGVLPDPAIAELSGQTEPEPPSLFAGSFTQFSGNGVGRYTGPGPVPPGYHLEGSRGFTAPEGAPNTRPVYSCRYSGGFFLALSVGCEGRELLGQAGWLYASPPSGGVPTAPVYRCAVVGSGDHYLSHRDDCESTPDRVRTEGLLGYVRMLAPLIRHRGPDGEHWASTHGQQLPTGYQAERALGYLALTDPGDEALRLRMCEVSDPETFDEFLSTDPDCDGERDLGAWPVGWLWPAPPTGLASRQLFACRGDDGERFESLDRFCEGNAEPGLPLGYVISSP